MFGEDTDARGARFEGSKYHTDLDPDMRGVWFEADPHPSLCRDWKRFGILASPAGLPVQFEGLAESPDVVELLEIYPHAEVPGISRRQLLQLGEAVSCHLLVRWVLELSSALDSRADAVPRASRYLGWVWLQHGTHALRRLARDTGTGGSVDVGKELERPLQGQGACFLAGHRVP